MEHIKPRLLAIGILLIALYAGVIGTTLAYMGIASVLGEQGFYRFCAIALGASPLAIAALVVTRIATGRLLLVTIAAGSSITLLLRMARDESTPAGLAFAFAFLVLLLVVELAVSRWERRREPRP